MMETSSIPSLPPFVGTREGLGGAGTTQCTICKLYGVQCKGYGLQSQYTVHRLQCTPWPDVFLPCVAKQGCGLPRTDRITQPLQFSPAPSYPCICEYFWSILDNYPHLKPHHHRFETFITVWWQLYYTPSHRIPIPVQLWARMSLICMFCRPWTLLHTVVHLLKFVKPSPR